MSELDEKAAAPVGPQPNGASGQANTGSSTTCNYCSISLRPEHLAHLRASGLTDDIIRERSYRSVTRKDELERLGFAPTQRRVPGLLLPVWAPDGTQPFCVYRPDNPRNDARGRPRKYEIPLGQGARLDVPPRCRPMLGDPKVPLWLTEGQKKADALAQHGLCAVALLGVWMFRGKNDQGGVTFLADWDYISLNGRTVYIVFDSDIVTKPEVTAALKRLTEHLRRKNATVIPVYLPPKPDGSKQGVDDYLLAHTVEQLKELASTQPASREPATPTLELLDDSPRILSRLLQLIDGRGYVTTWLWVRETITESLGKDGSIVIHNPPIVRTERRQFVLRDDGVVFGEGGDKPVAELGLQVKVSFTPRDGKLWSARAVKAYRAGYRPDPRGVFRRLVELTDRFMSFDRSLARQRTMCKLVACYALSTWFLDALDVVGFLWPSGGYGCGKTKLGTLICEVAYLGEVLLSGSTYACLRDLADVGATILLDDIEGLADPKRADPDKRNLLLAGNRRGTVVPVKELLPDGTWGTRYVNAYCPRLFTAIRLPDPVLASRTIVVPLVRSGDPRKANAEVLDEAAWPCDRQRLLDDLWSLALANLAKMPKHVEAVSADAPLVGRALEPWKGTLAVAHWLEAEGERRLYRLMCSLARRYQTERVELETPDLTRLVVEALLALATPLAPSAPLAPLNNPGAPFEISTSDVTNKVNELAIDRDLTDGNSGDYTTTRKVGRILATLRLKEAPKRSGQRRKRWVTLYQLDRIARSYGFSPILPDSPIPAPNDGPLSQTKGPPPPINGANGANGVNGAETGTQEVGEVEL